jgi:hypothetical protein
MTTRTLAAATAAGALTSPVSRRPAPHGATYAPNPRIAQTVAAQVRPWHRFTLDGWLLSAGWHTE